MMTDFSFFGKCRAGSHCVKWSVEGAVIIAHMAHSFIHSLCHLLPRSHCGLSQCCLFGVWLILQPLSYLFSLSLGDLGSPRARYELRDMAHGYRHGYVLTYFLLFIPASTSLTFVFPSSSGSHMHAFHIISNEHCVCRTEGKRPYMERRSLQCLERWDEEYERDFDKLTTEKGNSTEQALCSDLQCRILKCNFFTVNTCMSNFLHTGGGSLSLLFLCYAIVSSGLWMCSNSTGSVHC